MRSYNKTQDFVHELRNYMGSRYLDDDVSLLLLRVNVDIEVGLPVLNGLLDRLNRVAALLVVTLHLPVELGLGNKRDKRS